MSDNSRMTPGKMRELTYTMSDRDIERAIADIEQELSKLDPGSEEYAAGKEFIRLAEAELDRRELLVIDGDGVQRLQRESELLKEQRAFHAGLEALTGNIVEAIIYMVTGDAELAEIGGGLFEVGGGLAEEVNDQRAQLEGHDVEHEPPAIPETPNDPAEPAEDDQDQPDDDAMAPPADDEDGGVSPVDEPQVDDESAATPEGWGVVLSQSPASDAVIDELEPDDPSAAYVPDDSVPDDPSAVYVPDDTELVPDDPGATYSPDDRQSSDQSQDPGWDESEPEVCEPDDDAQPVDDPGAEEYGAVEGGGDFDGGGAE